MHEIWVKYAKIVFAILGVQRKEGKNIIGICNWIAGKHSKEAVYDKKQKIGHSEYLLTENKHYVLRHRKTMTYKKILTVANCRGKKQQRSKKKGNPSPAAPTCLLQENTKEDTDGGQV